MHKKADSFGMPAGLLRTLVGAGDTALRQRMTELLGNAGHTCDSASTGPEALTAVDRQRYILVFLQADLGGADAAAVTRRIRDVERATPGARRLPIVALCPDHLLQLREQCLAAGVDACLSSRASDVEILDASRALIEPQETDIPGLPRAVAQLLRRAPATVPADEPAGADAEPLDLDDLLSRCMGNRRLAGDLLLKFAQRVPADVDRLAATLNTGDAAQSARVAHGIKGVAANLAAAQVQSAAAEIERRSLAGDLTQAIAALDRLREQVGLCVQAIPPIAAGLASEPLSAGKGDMPCVL